jgi:hydrogenase nickel incorporation protein HypB
MCGTCGCSGDARIADAVSTGGLSPAHPYSHSHGQGHPPAHGHGHSLSDGHGHPPTRTVMLEQKVLARNDEQAAKNRSWLAERDLIAVNLMSSPGSGKTTLLERTIRDLSGQVGISVVEGDQETVFDAERIRATGCPVVQINTGAGCHLDADMLARALRTLDPQPSSVVFIENVGNLVCPALFDLGESARVVVMSATEGADKPLKYPHMFRTADVLLLNKTDLLPYVEFDVNLFREYVNRVNERARVIHVSATQGDGIHDWYGWLLELVRAGDSPQGW